MTVSLIVALVVTVACCGLVWLLPRAARVSEGEAEGHVAKAPAAEAGESSAGR
jgi:hypothetical protein